MKKKNLKNFRTILYTICMLIGIWIIDRILPSHIPATILYAIPLVFIAYRMNSRAVLFFSIIILLIHILENYLLHVPFFDWFFRSVGLAVIVYLAWIVAAQQQNLNKRIKEAEIAKNHLQIFLGIVTHDLTQPLTAIKLFIEVLLRNKKIKEEKQIRTVVEESEKAAKRMHRMINDLKDVTQLGMSDLALIPKKTNLSQLIAMLVANQQKDAPKHKIRLISTKKVIGTWDEERLRQLFNNILHNAIKYSPKGGEITVDVKKDEKIVRVSIADSGLGMTREQQEHLFRPFSRMHKGQSIKGIGLGLYICKAITEAHSGKIWVESKKNNGSIFYVELPIYTPPIS